MSHWLLMIFHYSIVSQSEEVYKITKWLLLRHGVFPATSVDKDVTVISGHNPPMWTLRALRKGNACHLLTIRLQPLPMVSPKEAQDVSENTGYWPQIAKMHMKGMISRSPVTHLPIHRKVLYSLTWDIWFSLTIFRHSDYLPFVVKLLCNLAHPLISSKQFSQGHLRCCLPGLKASTFQIR